MLIKHFAPYAREARLTECQSSAVGMLIATGKLMKTLGCAGGRGCSWTLAFAGVASSLFFSRAASPRGLRPCNRSGMERETKDGLPAHCLFLYL